METFGSTQTVGLEIRVTPAKRSVTEKK